MTHISLFSESGNMFVKKVTRWFHPIHAAIKFVHSNLWYIHNMDSNMDYQPANPKIELEEES